MKASRDIIVQVPDIAAATAFYEGVMGLSVFERSATLVGFEAGAFRLYVAAGRMPGAVFEFLVPDLMEARSRLVAAGCEVVDEDSAAPRCYVRDPFGLTFNIGQRG